MGPVALARLLNREFAFTRRVTSQAPRDPFESERGAKLAREVFVAIATVRKKIRLTLVPPALLR
jgi:hypothetical protein